MCIISCAHDDMGCFMKCSQDYQANLGQCPCQPGCPNACPCPVYECPVTTTTTPVTTTTAESVKTQVLILNTYKPVNVPVITNAQGREDRNFYFLMGENTEVKYSCALTFRNENYVFGGLDEKRQISKIVNCQLKNIGQLEFDHYYGGCANVADEKIYLCFNFATDDAKKCRVASSPASQFEEIAQSVSEHRWTRVAASQCKILLGYKGLKLF